MLVLLLHAKAWHLSCSLSLVKGIQTMQAPAGRHILYFLHHSQHTYNNIRDPKAWEDHLGCLRNAARAAWPA